MTQRYGAAVLIFALLVAVTLVAAAQPAAGTIRVLVVDGTKTFASTMRVAGLVGALRQVPVFEIGVALSDAASNWDDLLADQTNEEAPYDVVVGLPRGIDTGTVVPIWIVSSGLATMADDLRAGIDMIIGVASRVFAGAGEVKTVNDDLFPALLWGLYVNEGWMR